jgi:hypothetical protein
VLRGLSLATAAAMALASTGIQLGWHPLLVLGLIQLYAVCASPTFSIASTIIFARLADAQKEFGPIRAMATLGWMSGCWIVSALGADTSALAGWSWPHSRSCCLNWKRPNPPSISPGMSGSGWTRSPC